MKLETSDFGLELWGSSSYDIIIHRLYPLEGENGWFDLNCQFFNPDKEKIFYRENGKIMSIKNNPLFNENEVIAFIIDLLEIYCKITRKDDERFLNVINWWLKTLKK